VDEVSGAMTPERIGIGASRGTSPTSIVLGGRRLLSFAGCNYLGLAHDPRLISALAKGLEQDGISVGASRATTGNSDAHEELECDVARFLRCEAALLAPDGYLANLVIAQGLSADHDLALVDERAHSSLRDALAASRWRVVEYDHASATSAAERLRRSLAVEGRGLSGPSSPDRTESSGLPPRVAIFTDGVFPASSRVAPLRELLELLPTPGGTLVVDDSHATGVLGAHGRGTCEHLELSDPRVVITTTLSKALGCFGGLIVGSHERIRAARERSRAFVGSSPIPPALARAGSAAVAALASDPSRIDRLRANVAALRSRFHELDLPAPEIDLPVFPFTLESIERMQRVHEDLIERGILAPYIRYPDGMDDRRGYFRIALSSEHTCEDIDRLAAELAQALRR
jgi:7-keto-8-aminopelargonate synthetase-like enzyme